MRVNHNPTSLNALRHLGETNRATETNLERLSSGLRINSGKDGPADMIVSEIMRAQISGLNQSIKNSEIGVSMVQTAEGTLSEISAMLINMRQLALHAANEGANDQKMVQADQNEAERLLSTIDRLAMTTGFGNKPLFDGGSAVTGVTVGQKLRFVGATPETKNAPTKTGWEVDIQQIATRAYVSGLKPVSLQNVEEGIELLINEGNRVIELKTMEDNELAETLQSLVQNHRLNPQVYDKEQVESAMATVIARSLHDKARESGLKVDVYINEMGMLTVRHKMFGSEPNFSVVSSIPGILAEKAFDATYSDGGQDVGGYIGGEVSVGKGQFLYGGHATPIEGLVVEYSGELETRVEDIKDGQGNVVGQQLVRSTAEELISDEVDGYVHVAQNSVTYQIGPNANQTVRFSLGNLRTDNMSRGIDNESEYRSLADIDLTSGEGAQDALILIDEAIDELTVLRGDLGSFQRNSLENNLKNLRVAQENMVNAESVIRDTDMAKEMSDFTKNQILLASGTAMAAQANQIPKSVLQLLGGAQ